jgi:hypothetical protein
LHCRPGDDPEEIGATNVWSGPDEPELHRVLGGIVTAIERGIFFANAGAGRRRLRHVRRASRLRHRRGPRTTLRAQVHGSGAATIYFDLDAKQPEPGGGA